MQARKLANLTYFITARSCSKIMMANNYWKSFVLPGVYFMRHQFLPRQRKRKKRKTGMEADIGRTEIHSGGGFARRNWYVNGEEQRY